MRKLRGKYMLCIYVCGLLLLPFQLRAENSVRAVNALEFLGLHVLSKYVLAEQAGVTVAQNKILLNVDRLRNVLDKHEYIKSYKLIDKNSKITIVVIEQDAVLSLAIAREQHTELYELNAHLQVVATGTIYNGANPLVVLTEHQFQGKIFSEQVKKRLRLLLQVHRQLAVWNEIKSIDARDDSLMSVRLNARKTNFSVAYTMKSFEQLNVLVGYLDATQYYPEHLDVSNDFTVMR